jgi:hypothetical protein
MANYMRRGGGGRGESNSARVNTRNRTQVPYKEKLGQVCLVWLRACVAKDCLRVHHVMLSSQYPLSVWGSILGVPGSHGLFEGLGAAGARSRNWKSCWAPSVALREARARVAHDVDVHVLIER